MYVVGEKKPLATHPIYLIRTNGIVSGGPLETETHTVPSDWWENNPGIFDREVQIMATPVPRVSPVN